MSQSMTSSQSSTPAPCNVGNGVVTSSDGRWNQVDSTNMLQNTTPPVWNELPPKSVVLAPVSANNVSSEYHATSRANSVNVISNQVVYPPNYMNIHYQRNNVANGYAFLNPTRGNPQIINGQNLLPTQNGQIYGGPGWPSESALGRVISQSPGWTNNKTTGGVKKQKRIRIAFTTQQMMQLEQEYARTRYLDRARRMELADLLRLNERTIKIWFQNRRMKEKKDRAESMADSEEVSTSESSPEMSNIQMPMLIHEQHPGSTNEVHNQGNSYVEHYPDASTPISMPGPTVPTSTLVQSSVQSMFETFMSEEICRALQYQQVHSYQAPYSEVQESPAVEPRDAPATSSAPSAIIQNSWDLSWLRSVNNEEDFN